MGRKIVIKRGDIWVADLRSVGSEISKKRPLLIVSNTTLNELSPTIITIPFSSRVPKIFGPEAVFASKKEAGITKDSIIITFQLRALSKEKLIKRIGKLKKEKMKGVEESLKVVLGLLNEA